MDFSHLLKKRRAAASRGFTLIELMVVVVIIGILAAISLPQVVQRMRNRRGTQAAQTVALMYRNARLRALGRGFAVIVKYSAGNGFQIRETLPMNGVADCMPHLPLTCTNTDWVNPLSTQLVDTFNPEDYAGTTAVMSDATLAQTAPYLDICFSAHGRTYARTAVGNALTPTTDMFSMSLSGGKLATSSSDAGAQNRYIVEILPNGMARVAL